MLLVVLLVLYSAHVMPKDQLYRQLEVELGEDWRSKFQEFDDVPIAAASIGQVLLGHCFFEVLTPVCGADSVDVLPCSFL